MQSNVENLEALERSIELSLSQEQIHGEVDKRLKSLAKKVKMHGFRPGKVPLKLVTQQYGAQVQQEVIEDALQKEFAEAVKNNELQVVGYPSYAIKQDGDMDENTEHLIFTAKFEVYPTIALGDLSQVNIEKPVTTVESADIDKTMEMIRKQHVQYQAVDRAVSEGDRVTIDYRGMLDGKDFDGGKAEDVQLIVADGKFLKDFETALIGMSVGEEKSFDVTFPEEYHGKELAGKTANFTVNLKLIESPILPEINEDFAKKLGIVGGEVDKLREAIQHDLEREVIRQVRSKLKTQVMRSLMDVNPIDAPSVLIKQEIDRLMESARQDFAAKGMDIGNIQLKPELFQNKAEHRIKLGLILAELVKVHNLKATPDQVRSVIEESAQAYENPEEVIKWHYASKERLQDAESLALEENVVQWVLGQVNVVEKTVAFDELMGLTKT